MEEKCKEDLYNSLIRTGTIRIKAEILGISRRMHENRLNKKIFEYVVVLKLATKQVEETKRNAEKLEAHRRHDIQQRGAESTNSRNSRNCLRVGRQIIMSEKQRNN